MTSDLGDIIPKEFYATLGKEKYRILPFSIGTQLKILRLFQEDEQDITWEVIFSRIQSGTPEATAKLCYAMIDWSEKPKKLNYDDFLNLLMKDPDNDLGRKVDMAISDSLPQDLKKKPMTDKEMIKNMKRGLVILTLWTFFVIGITFLLMNIFA